MTMTEAQRIKSAAAARGLKMKDIARRVGAHPAAFSKLISGKAQYPKAAEYLAAAKALLCITDPEPIPYDRASYAADSTGITLPHELLEFLRNKARADRASNPQASMSRLFVEAVEDRYRPELLDHLAARRRERTGKSAPSAA